jgi:hypothetical protein
MRHSQGSSLFVRIMNERLESVQPVYSICYTYLCQSTHTYTYNYLSGNIKKTFPVFYALVVSFVTCILGSRSASPLSSRAVRGCSMTFRGD